MEGFRDPFFRGCTRPPMFLGVPLTAFLVFGGALLIPAMWAFAFKWLAPALLLGVTWLLGHLYMRAATRKDDQRILQWMLRLRMRVIHKEQFRVWRTVTLVPSLSNG